MTHQELLLNWWRVDATNAFESEILRRLLSLWQSKRRGERLPSRADFQPEEFFEFGGRIALIDVENDPRRYRYRLIGTRITDALGRDSTGRYLDELYAADYFEHMAPYFERIVTERVPRRTFGSMAHSHKPHVPVEGIDLPLASDGVTVDMIVRALDFDFGEDRNHPKGFA